MVAAGEGGTPEAAALEGGPHAATTNFRVIRTFPGHDFTMSETKGRCILAGAGPGDIGLVTLRAKEAIEAADVIVYDYLVNPAVLSWAKPDAEIVYAGKKAGAHTLKQEEINALIVARAQVGKTVLRLKGGDPYLFGRGGEEAVALRDAGVPFEIVPGVTSGIAAPAYAGIPVTHREHASQVTFVTGHEDPAKAGSSLDYAWLAKAPGTKVIYMGVERLGPITAGLIAHGADTGTPAALVRWGTTGKQRTLVATLGDLAAKAAEAGFAAPAIAVIGGVVGLREQLSWFEGRPLAGKRIVVTRTRKQAGALSRALGELGAEVLEIPAIRIAPPKDARGFAELVRDAHLYDWVLFTSPNGAEAFFEMFFKLYEDARAFGGGRIGAIGPGTDAKIREYRFKADLQPEEALPERMIEALEKEYGTVENLRVLVVRPEVARDALAAGLTAKGAIVDEAAAYRTVAETADRTGALARLRDEPADVIAFTSSSTVEHFLALGVPIPEGTAIASIGPITSAALRERGLPIAVEAAEHTIPGLVAAIRAHLA